jgi:ketosteroid isomerase-like protein
VLDAFRAVERRQRGLSPSGERFDDEVLGLYEVRDGKFARAQMFYSDGAAVQRFLASADVDAASRRRRQPVKPASRA